MRIDSAIITGSFSVNGDTFNDLGSYSTTGSNAFTGSQNITGSIVVSGSFNLNDSATNFSIQGNTFSQTYLNSNGAIVLNPGYGGVEMVGSYRELRLNDIYANGFVSGEIRANNGVVSGSSQIDITSTTGYSTFSSSNASIDSTQNSRLNSLEEKTGSLATTGSNIFYGNQTISGTVYIQSDLIVQGSSCIQNITGSSLNIGTNIVSLNTATPSVRYAGLTVQDSGSSAGVTGSILWDSLCNRWMYSNPSTVGYSGGIIMSGPRAATLGAETTLTCNYIAKSGGGDHLYDSCIQDVSGSVTIGGTICTSGAICASTLSSAGCIFIGGMNVNTNPGVGYALSINSSNLADCRSIQFYSADGTYNPRVTIKHITTTNSHTLNFDSGFSTGTGYANFIFNVNGGSFGIGTSAPSGNSKVEISAAESIPTLRLNRTTNTGYGSQFHLSSLSCNRFVIGLNPNDDLYIDRDTTGGGAWNPSTLVIQRSTGYVGINCASPSFNLDVNGTGRFGGMITSNTGNNTRLFTSTGATTGYQYMDMYNTSGRLVWGVDSSSGGALASGTLANGGVIYGLNSLQLGVDGVMKLTINSAGNFGIGTASPCNIISARGNMDLGSYGLSYVGPSQYGGIVFPKGQILFSNTNPQSQLYLSSNAYTNPSGVFSYRCASTPALALGLDNGSYSFLTAASGTADATISWNLPLIVDNTGVYMANTNTPINIKPENTPSTAITSLSSASSTYNQRPGVYWLNFGSQIFLGYVRFNWHQGRNWVLALKVFNVHDMPAGSSLWQNNTLVNQSDFALNNGRMAKYGAWNNFAFTRLLYEMGNRIPPIMQWNSSKSSLYSVFSSISVGNGSGVGPDSTDPQLSASTSTTYSGMTNFLGPNFPDFGGAEPILNYYGLGSFANTSINSTTATNTGIASGFGLTTEHLGTFSNLQSTGRAGAWIGAPMDEAAAYFNRTSSGGADSGFGLGVAGGNNARTSTSGIISWALGNQVANFLPAYVWLSID